VIPSSARSALGTTRRPTESMAIFMPTDYQSGARRNPTVSGTNLSERTVALAATSAAYGPRAGPGSW
jgi:hypothetical protein